MAIPKRTAAGSWRVQLFVRGARDAASFPTKRGRDFELLRVQAFLRHDAFPAHVPLSDLQPEHLAHWRDARLARVKAASVLRDLVLLSHVLEVARREWRWIAANPIRLLKYLHHSTARLSTTVFWFFQRIRFSVTFWGNGYKIDVIAAFWTK